MQDKQKKYWVTSQLDSNTAVILLYGYIYDACAADFIKELHKLEKSFGQINVRINSGGGDVFDGFAIYNAMKQSPVDIHTYADGVAGSMGSIVLQGGKKRFVSKVAQVMTHKPSAGVHGDSEELKKGSELLASVENMMCAIYASSTGQSTEDCKAKFLNGKDNWFDAVQAISEGLADEIYDAEPIALPAAASQKEEETWKSFNTLRFAAVFDSTQKKQNDNMEIKLSAATKAALKIGDNADQAAIDAIIIDMAGKASQFDAMKTEKEAAEQKLKELNDAAITGKVTGMLTTALGEKKITQATHDTLATQFKENPDGLKAVLDTMQPFVSIIKPSEGTKTRLEALTAKTWNELDKSGELKELKEISLDEYKVKFKAEFKKDFPG